MMKKTIPPKDKCPLFPECRIGRKIYSSSDLHRYCEKHWTVCPSYVFQMKRIGEEDNPSRRRE